MKIPQFDKIPTVAVYRKRTNGNCYMIVTEKEVDTVNNAQARKPLIPHKYQIIELGVGQSFIEIWMEKYKIKKFEII
jgi:hypothetical protein